MTFPRGRSAALAVLVLSLQSLLRVHGASTAQASAVCSLPEYGQVDDSAIQSLAPALAATTPFLRQLEASSSTENVDTSLRKQVEVERCSGPSPCDRSGCGSLAVGLCPIGFQCGTNTHCAIGSSCSANGLCADGLSPRSLPAAFFDAALILQGVTASHYIQMNLERVIREVVSAALGHGVAYSDVGILRIDSPLSSVSSTACPPLMTVVLRVDVSNPVVWSPIWLKDRVASTTQNSLIAPLITTIPTELTLQLSPYIPRVHVSTSSVTGLFGRHGDKIVHGSALELAMQDAGATQVQFAYDIGAVPSVDAFDPETMQDITTVLRNGVPSDMYLLPSALGHASGRRLQATVCCDCPVNNTGEVLYLQRIVTGSAVDKTNTDVTLGVSAGLFVGILLLIGLYKAWWKQYRARQHAQSLRWRRSRSAAGDVELETFHTSRVMPSAASHILGTQATPSLNSPTAGGFRRTTVAPPQAPVTATPSGPLGSRITQNPLVKSEIVQQVEEKRAGAQSKWERVVDEEGDVYYYNPTTGQSTWNEPPNASPPS